MNFDAYDLIELVTGMADMDFATMPGPMFLGALRRELVENEFTAENAEAIVVRIGIVLQNYLQAAGSPHRAGIFQP